MTLGETSDKDLRHCHFLKSTCDIAPPPLIKGPIGRVNRVCYGGRGDDLCPSGVSFSKCVAKGDMLGQGMGMAD